MVRGALAGLLSLEPDIEVVAQVARGDEVLAAALAQRPDVALLDIEMPGADGLEAAGAAARRAARLQGPDAHHLRAARATCAAPWSRAPPASCSRTIRPRSSPAPSAGRCAASASSIPGLAAAALSEGPSPLTPREHDVLAAAREHATVADIASALHLSPGHGSQLPLGRDGKGRGAQPRRGDPRRRGEGVALTHRVYHPRNGQRSQRENHEHRDRHEGRRRRRSPGRARHAVRHRQPHRSQLRDRDHRRHGALDRLPPDQGRRRRLRADDLRPGVHEHGVVSLGDHLPRRRGRRPRVPRLPDRAARRAVDLPRGRLPARPRRAAHGRAARGVDRRDHDPHLRAREHQGLHAGLPPRRPPDGDAARLGRRAVDVLSRTPTTSRTRRTATSRPSG